jgi:serine/threonine protein kinase
MFEGVVLGKKLGAGSFGTVYVGLLPNGTYVAVKQLDIQQNNEGQADEINQEVEVHKHLVHTNIIRYLGSVKKMNETPPKLYVFLEFVTGGSLTAVMKCLPDARFPISVVKVYSRHMFEGLNYLHNKSVAHRDIKGDNILIAMDTGIAKLADFDQAKVTGTVAKAKTLAGTPFWMAPEVITEDAGYNPMKADIWSAGCTVAEMATGKAPWTAMQTPMAVVCKIASSKGWPDNIKPEGMPADLVDFLNQCFERDPAKRPGAEMCLAHPFLKV